MPFPNHFTRVPSQGEKTPTLHPSTSLSVSHAASTKSYGELMTGWPSNNPQGAKTPPIFQILAQS